MAPVTSTRAATLKAALWMTGGIVSFSSMAIAGREVAVELDTFETMMYRSFIGLVIVLAVAAATGRLGEIKAERLPLHTLRNLFHFTGQNLWFYAVTLIPLAQVFALEFTTPIWVMLLAPFFLGERWTRMRTIAALLGFLGVLMVARPGSTPITPGIIAAALAAIAFAGTFICTKRLTRVASITGILFWLTAIQSVFGIIAVFYDGTIAIPTMATLPWVVLIGFAGLFAHLCVTNALALAPASVVVPLDFLRLPLIALIGMAVYNEPLDIWVLLGAVVIFSANYANIRAETRAVTIS